MSGIHRELNIRIKLDSSFAGVPAFFLIGLPVTGSGLMFTEIENKRLAL
jgi:hypothetical protein